MLVVSYMRWRIAKERNIFSHSSLPLSWPIKADGRKSTAEAQFRLTERFRDSTYYSFSAFFLSRWWMESVGQQPVLQVKDGRSKSGTGKARVSSIHVQSKTRIWAGVLRRGSCEFVLKCWNHNSRHSGSHKQKQSITWITCVRPTLQSLQDNAKFQ